ncbi:MAG: hypothetical protein WC352_08825, partial [Candidatus Omnitrophota bacterium]
ENPPWRRTILKELKEAELEEPMIRSLFGQFGQFEGGESKPPALAKVLSRIDDEGFKARLVAVFAFEWSPEDKEKAFTDCLKNIIRKRREKRLAELMGMIASSERDGQAEALGGYVREYQALLKAKE